MTLMATDKTGTLTEGSMRVAGIWTPSDRDEAALWPALALCNDAEPAAPAGPAPGGRTAELAGRPHGDPMEVAMLEAAVEHGVDVHHLRAEWPRIDEEPFDRVRRSMTVTCRGSAGTWTIARVPPR